MDVEHFTPNAAAVMAPVRSHRQDQRRRGADRARRRVLRAIAPTLAFDGLDPAKVKLLGTGLVGRSRHHAGTDA